MKPAAPIRLLLVDDHLVVRAGLAAVLKFDARFQVIAEASDGAAAVDAHRKHQPDITLLDVRMPVLDGIEAARRIRAESPAARLLMLTTYDAEEDIRRALDAGASGYLLKNSSQDDLINALLTVQRGERWLPAGLARRLREHTQEAALSARQLEVLELLAKGLSNKEIAAVLGPRLHHGRHQVSSAGHLCQARRRRPHRSRGHRHSTRAGAGGWMKRRRSSERLVGTRHGSTGCQSNRPIRKITLP